MLLNKDSNVLDPHLGTLLYMIIDFLPSKIDFSLCDKILEDTGVIFLCDICSGSIFLTNSERTIKVDILLHKIMLKIYPIA